MGKACPGEARDELELGGEWNGSLFVLEAVAGSDFYDADVVCIMFWGRREGSMGLWVPETARTLACGMGEEGLESAKWRGAWCHDGGRRRVIAW